MYIPLALVLNGRKLGDREIRVKKCLESAEAIQKQKLMDAAMNGRKKGKKQIKRKIVVKEGEKKEKKGEKKEGKKKEKKGEKKEGKKEGKKEVKEKGDKKNVKSDKKRKVDLSFMGNRTKLSINAINANRRLMKKMKK